MAADATAALEVVRRARARTRVYRNGHWVASFIFGVVILGSMPFYLSSTRPGNGFWLFGRAFQFAWGSRWSTIYWVIAMVLAYVVVIASYHLRAMRVGVQGRIWPAVVAGVAFLGLAILVNDDFPIAPDFWFRGTSTLLVIAVGLLVLALLEKSRPFAAFAAGFFCLALVSCLYDIVNIFDRLRIGGPFGGGAGLLPNLLVPGCYLVIGGVVFFVFQARRDVVAPRLAPPTT